MRDVYEIIKGMLTRGLRTIDYMKYAPSQMHLSASECQA